MQAQEVRELLLRTKEGDQKAREKLVVDNIGLIWSVVKRFSHRGHDLEDLFQIGSIGLLKAIDKFDLSYDVQFSTYAVPMITGEIKRFLRDDGMVKVSRSLKEKAYRIQLEREKIERKYQREATMEELAKEADVALEEIVVALEANKDVESIYQTMYQGEGTSILLLDQLANDEDEEMMAVHHVLLEYLLERLSESERMLIELRYYKGKTQQEIAKILNISQVQVSRMEKKIIGRMRKMALGYY